MVFTKIILAAMCVAYPAIVGAGHLDLAWNPNSEPDIGGYIVYYGTVSQDYDNFIHVGTSTSAHITGLMDNAEYFFALTAYDMSGNESTFSAEISGYALPGGGPLPSATGHVVSDSGCFIKTANGDFPKRVRQLQPPVNHRIILH
jgi:hypothetical protein